MQPPHDDGAALLVGSGETMSADEWQRYVHQLRDESVAAGWEREMVEADLRAGLDSVVLADSSDREWRYDLARWTYRHGTAQVPGRPDGPLSIRFAVFHALDEADLAAISTISPMADQWEAELARLDATTVLPPPPLATSPSPSPSPSSPSRGFAPTHRVPAAGMRTWPEPGATATGPALDPHLAVEVVDRWGSWARIVCENGWGAWVDGRLLVDLAGTAPPAPTPARNPTARPDANSAWRRPTRATWIMAAGAALAALATTMPWYHLGAGLESLNGYDVPVAFLVDYEQPGDGLKLGLVVLVLSALALVVHLRRGWERWAAPLAGAVGLAGTAFVVQTQRQLSAFSDLGGEVPGLTDVVGIGVVAVIVGAGVMVWGARAR